MLNIGAWHLRKTEAKAVLDLNRTANIFKLSTKEFNTWFERRRTEALAKHVTSRRALLLSVQALQSEGDVSPTPASALERAMHTQLESALAGVEECYAALLSLKEEHIENYARAYKEAAPQSEMAASRRSEHVRWSDQLKVCLATLESLQQQQKGEADGSGAEADGSGADADGSGAEADGRDIRDDIIAHEVEDALAGSKATADGVQYTADVLLAAQWTLEAVENAVEYSNNHENQHQMPPLAYTSDEEAEMSNDVMDEDGYLEVRIDPVHETDDGSESETESGARALAMMADARSRAEYLERRPDSPVNPTVAPGGDQGKKAEGASFSPESMMFSVEAILLADEFREAIRLSNLGL
jgi:hypothetical protein